MPFQRNAPETVAALTGGESFKLTDAKSLERSLASISNHLPNRYSLSFQLQAPGLHALSLQLTELRGLQLAARKSYWAIPVQP